MYSKLNNLINKCFRLEIKTIQANKNIKIGKIKYKFIIISNNNFSFNNLKKKFWSCKSKIRNFLLKLPHKINQKKNIIFSLISKINILYKLFSENLIIQSIINIFLLISTFIFSQLKHPLAIGFLLLIQTILICIITGIIYDRFWFSYILFLVFLGGILVLFIYVTSLASNEIFNFSFKLFLIIIICIYLLVLRRLLIDNIEFTFINNKELLNSNFKFFELENFKSIYKLYNFPTNWITLILINYLFFTLIVVVKITNFFYGPLRNLN